MLYRQQRYCTGVWYKRERLSWTSHFEGLPLVYALCDSPAYMPTYQIQQYDNIELLRTTSTAAELLGHGAVSSTAQRNPSGSKVEAHHILVR